MIITLTEQDRLMAQHGEPVDVIDPQTNESYVLIARHRFEELKLSGPARENGAPASGGSVEPVIPEGIRLSLDAYRRDLPDLLKDGKIYGHWVAYHHNERLGIATREQVLLADCYRRGLTDDEIFVGWIHEYGLIEEEEVEPRPQHFVEREHEDT